MVVFEVNELDSLGIVLLEMTNLSVAGKFDVCIEVLIGLGHVHNAGFVHGCINPSNISLSLLNTEGRLGPQLYTSLLNFERSLEEKRT